MGQTNRGRIPPHIRQTKILEMLQQTGSVDVSELSSRFEVSEMSIRNDLNSLDRQGKLVRRHGGAELTSTLTMELPLTERQKENYTQKRAICKKAATLLSNGMSAIFDAGTTNEHMVQFLGDLVHLTIITNGINVINGLLDRPDVQIYTVGGRVDHRSCSIIGENAEDGLRQYSAQIGFVTADGLSLSHGVTNNSQEATNMSRIIIGNSKSTVLLADSSKVGRIGVFQLCQWKQIDMWVTDEGVKPETVAAVESLGVRVLIADE